MKVAKKSNTGVQTQYTSTKISIRITFRPSTVLASRCSLESCSGCQSSSTTLLAFTTFGQSVQFFGVGCADFRRWYLTRPCTPRFQERKLPLWKPLRDIQSWSFLRCSKITSQLRTLKMQPKHPSRSWVRSVVQDFRIIVNYIFSFVL